MTANWKAIGQEKKARHLLAAFDLALRGNDIDPESAYAVQLVLAADETVWSKAIAEAAKLTGIAYDHASEETRTLVLEMFRTRAGLASLDRETGAEVERAGKSIDPATMVRRSLEREEPPPHGPCCSCHGCYAEARR